MKETVVMMLGLLLCANLALADDLKDAADQVPLLSERLTKLRESKAGEYARPALDAAQDGIGAVKASIAAKNGTQALQKAERAELQLTLAEAKAAEQESVELLVLRRAELRKLETQFDQLLQTGGN